MIPIPDGLCPEALKLFLEARDHYRRGAVAHVDGDMAIAEVLFRKGLRALDRANRVQAIADEKRRRGLFERAAVRS